MAFELTNFVSHARACSILRNLVISRRGPGGVFLLPANVCPVVPLTLLTARQPFEFIDVDPNDLSMDRALVNRRLECPEPYVAGIIYVRSYGFLADISDSFSSWKVSSPDRLIVDDRCLSPPEVEGANLEGADAILFSTGYGKYVDLGSGGFAYLAPDTPYVETSPGFVPGHAARVEAFLKGDTGTGRRATEWVGVNALLSEFPLWLPSRPVVVPTEYLRRIRKCLVDVTEHKMRVNDVYRRRIRNRSKWMRTFAVGDFSSGYQIRTCY